MEKPETPEPSGIESEPEEDPNVVPQEKPMEDVDVDPEPEEGDFYDDLPLDKDKDADAEDSNPEGDDNDVPEDLREKK